MSTISQKLVPGLVGISTYVDFAYQREMQLAAVSAGHSDGPINQLKTVTVTIDFNALINNLRDGRREAAEDQVAAACQMLYAAGSDFIVVTSGTTSTLTTRARQQVSIPFLDIAEACWKQGSPINPVGLLSTRYAAAGGIFQKAASRRGTTLILPAAETAIRVDQTIFDELVRGKVSDTGLSVFRNAIDELIDRGAASIILGNTDLTLVQAELQESAKAPLIDAALLHARYAAHWALKGIPSGV
jgi:aspartate racemase